MSELSGTVVSHRTYALNRIEGGRRQRILVESPHFHHAVGLTGQALSAFWESDPVVEFFTVPDDVSPLDLIYFPGRRRSGIHVATDTLTLAWHTLRTIAALRRIRRRSGSATATLEELSEEQIDESTTYHPVRAVRDGASAVYHAVETAAGLEPLARDLALAMSKVDQPGYYPYDSERHCAQEELVLPGEIRKSDLVPLD